MGSTQITLQPNGMIKLSNSRGDSYDIHLSLTRASDGQWFTASNFSAKSLKVNEQSKTALFRGSFTAPESEPIGVEYSMSLVEGKTRVALRFLTETPISKVLSLANIHVHSSRSDIAGHSVDVDGISYPVKETAPEGRQSKPLFPAGQVKSVTYFANDPARKLVFKSVKSALVAGFDYNVTGTAPYVQLRFLPQDNQITFDIEMSSVTVASSGETYGGVDFHESGNLRLPRYGLSRNLVQNPSFEQGLHFWHFGPLGKLTASRLGDYHLVDEQNVFIGRRALKILGEQGQSPAHAATIAIPVETGETYTASFYAKADRPGITLDTIFTTAVWTVFPVHKKIPLSTEWKRYELSFKAPNGIVSMDFGVDNPATDCAVWIDAVQLEKGELTEYTEKPASATLVTARRDNIFQPGEKVQGRLEVFGTPGSSIEVASKMTDFFGRTVREDKGSITLDTKGMGTLTLPWAEGLDSGLYLIESNIRMLNGFADRSFDRLAILKFADNTARHKNIFAYGGSDARRGDWTRKFEFFRKAGIGSAVIFDPPGNDYLSILAKNSLLNVSSIFHGGEKSGEWNLKTDYAARTDADLKLIEERAYEVARNYPEIRHWKTINEPGMNAARSLDEMKLFIRPVLAAYKGIKRANPTAIVFSPDPANMSPHGGIRWLDAYLEAGGKAACDAIAVHPYRTRPEEPDLDSDTTALLSMLAKHSYQGEVWFTEGIGHPFIHLPAFGINVHKSLSQEEGGGWRAGPLTYDLSWGERVSAAYNMRSWLAALKHSERVKQSVEWYYPTNSSLDLDMTPGAAVFASNTLVHLLGNSTFRQDIELGEGMRGYLFEDEQKRPVAALWSHDIKVDKGEEEGPLLDISGLPMGVESIDFTGNTVTKTTELQLSPFPVFLRGNPGSMESVSAALSRLPVKSSNGRQLLSFLEVTSQNEAALRLQNILSRPATGHLRVHQENQTLFSNNITVEGKATWSLPLKLSSNNEHLRGQKLRVEFQPDNGTPVQVSDVELELLAVTRAIQPMTIDGNLADWPTRAAIPLPHRLVEFNAKATPHQGAADLSATMYAAWDNDNLYLAWNVRDDIVVPGSTVDISWQGDGVQLYFDSWQNARKTVNRGYDGDDQVYDVWPSPEGVVVRRAVAPEKQIGFTAPGVVSSVRTAYKRTKEGYILELAIPAREVAPISLQTEVAFGFGLIVNDKDDQTGRKRGLILTPDGTEPHLRPDLYPIMVLQ